LGTHDSITIFLDSNHRLCILYTAYIRY